MVTALPICCFLQFLLILLLGDQNTTRAFQSVILLYLLNRVTDWSGVFAIGRGFPWGTNPCFHFGH